MGLRHRPRRIRRTRTRITEGTNFEKGAHYAREGHGRTPSSAHVMAPGGHPRLGPKSRGNPAGLRVSSPARGGMSHRFELPKRMIGGTGGVNRPARRLCSQRPPRTRFGNCSRDGGGEDRAASWPPVARRASQICLRHRPEVLRHKRRQPPPLIPARRTNRRTCCDAARTQGDRTSHQAIRPTKALRTRGRLGGLETE